VQHLTDLGIRVDHALRVQFIYPAKVPAQVHHSHQLLPRYAEERHGVSWHTEAAGWLIASEHATSAPADLVRWVSFLNHTLRVTTSERATRFNPTQLVTVRVQ
jgi:hypothetical protein